MRTKEGPSSSGLAVCERILVVTPSPFPPRTSPVALPQGQPSRGGALTAEKKTEELESSVLCKKEGAFNEL